MGGGMPGGGGGGASSFGFQGMPHGNYSASYKVPQASPQVQAWQQAKGGGAPSQYQPTPQSNPGYASDPTQYKPVQRQISPTQGGAVYDQSGQVMPGVTPADAGGVHPMYTSAQIQAMQQARQQGLPMPSPVDPSQVMSSLQQYGLMKRSPIMAASLGPNGLPNGVPNPAAQWNILQALAGSRMS